MVAKPRIRGESMQNSVIGLTENTEQDTSAMQQTQQHTSEQKQGLRAKRYYTHIGKDPFDLIDWELRSAIITGENGEVVFGLD